MIGDDALWAPIGRQGRKEELQERGEILMFGSHPRQNRARVTFQNAEALDPPPLQLDEIANIDKPEMVPIVRAIR